MKKLIYTLALVIIASSLTAGGGWPQPKGKGYFKAYSWWIISNQHFTDSGQIDPNITSGIFNNGIYVEYGLTNRITIIANAPLYSRSFVNNLRSKTTGEILSQGDAINSIGDIDLGVKFGISKPGSRIALAATLNLGLPTGNELGGINNNLQTGDGEFNQYLQLDAGTSFSLGKLPLYANVYTGVNNRTNGFSDELRYGFEIGAGFIDQKLWLTGRINGISSFENGNGVSGANSTSIFANDAEYTSFGLEAAYYLTKNVGISASIASAFEGRIIYAAPSYSVGVFYHLK